MTTKRSTKPFPATLTELLEEAELGQRGLVRLTRKKGWGSQGVISALMTEDLHPTIRAMEAIAAALQVSPEVFAEYRLAKARERIDERVVGLKTALRNLG